MVNVPVTDKLLADRLPPNARLPLSVASLPVNEPAIASVLNVPTEVIFDCTGLVTALALGTVPNTLAPGIFVKLAPLPVNKVAVNVLPVTLLPTI